MSKVIVALDGMNREQSLHLASELASSVWGFKVNDLLLECGVSIISELKQHGKVFADPKLYDIPNTVANGVSRIAAAGADLITVHASGGPRMMEAAVKASDAANILGITVVTSLENSEVQSVYSNGTAEQVSRLAALAADAGVFGVVCSPEELSLLSADARLSNLAKVTPGVRPSWYGTSDDQRRIATPEKAISDGASLLVIGRPITSADNPKEAAQRIGEELGEI